MREQISGTYGFRDGRFEPDDGMVEVERRTSGMRLLFGGEEGRPSFYKDDDGCYWELRDFEDYRKELTPVDAEYIRTNYPTVELERTV